MPKWAWAIGSWWAGRFIGQPGHLIFKVCLPLNSCRNWKETEGRRRRCETMNAATASLSLSHSDSALSANYSLSCISKSSNKQLNFLPSKTNLCLKKRISLSLSVHLSSSSDSGRLVVEDDLHAFLQVPIFFPSAFPQLGFIWIRF